MRAIVVREIGGPLELEEVTLADPGPGQVRVRMVASGVCHSDVSFQTGTIPYPMPIVLGHEGAGVVTAVGDGVLAPAVGDHVIINWVPFCDSCPACRRGERHLCPHGYGLSEPRTMLGEAPVFPAASVGTFCEEVVVHSSSAIPIPADVPLDVAALVGCGVTTGLGAAMNTARVVPGSSVVVFGAGGVGVNVIQGARVCGASAIVAVDPAESKHEGARRFGATHATTPDALPGVSQEITGGEGFDYAFEVVGSAVTIRAAYDATRRGGTTTIVGVGRFDEQVAFSPFELFYKEVKLLGSVYGSSDVIRDFPRVLSLWKSGRIDLEGLISKRIALEDVQSAFDAMLAGEVIRSVIDF